MSHVSTGRRSKRWILPLLVVLVWLFVGGPLGSFAGKLTAVQENENANFLPQSTESTLVLQEFLRFTGQESVCLLYTSPSPRDLSTSRMPSSA